MLFHGKYYLNETSAIEGYDEYDELIEINLSLHEQFTIDVFNSKEQKSEIETKISNKNKQVKKLPVTGI